MNTQQISEEDPTTSFSEEESNLDIILLQENLALSEVFTTGHSGCVVVKAIDSEGKTRVVKIPTDENSQNEIYGNINGFENLINEGLSDLTPEPIKISRYGDLTYVTEAYLGKDFAIQTRESETPEQLYEILALELSRIYQKTISEDGRGTESVRIAIDLLRYNCQAFLVPAGYLHPDDLAVLEFDEHISGLAGTKSCFACFDFTPEDIYLTEEGLKYPDPKHKIRGNPLIDLACFSGVARDVYKLPGAEKGYDRLTKLAFNDVANLLDLDSNSASIIFAVGKALQCSLSSRFRIGIDNTTAEIYGRRVSEILQDLYTKIRTHE